MASPQLEDGFTPIANEILETLARMPLAPNQWRVLLYIIRKTYGFHKKVDYIANFQIGQATGLCKAVVSRCLKDLHDRNLITRKGKFIGFRKDWEKWQGLAFQTHFDEKLAEPSTSEPEVSNPANNEKLAESSTELAESSTKVSSCAVTQKIKDTITKDTIKDTRPKKKKYLFDNILLTEEEYRKLVDRFGEEGVKDKLDNLSLYKKSKGKRYASDYATILSWDRKDMKGGRNGTHRGNFRRLIKRKNYHEPRTLRQ